MNYTITAKIIGIVLGVESLFLLPPLGLSIYDHDGTTKGILMVIGIMLLVGSLAYSISPRDRKVAPKDGLLIVSLAWVVASIFGALPLFFCTEMSYVDSFFEIVSGFTTTGATVISKIEDFPRSVVLWRSITHWLGGMGILVFTVGLLPKLGVGGFQMFKAESPGPIPGKIESTVSQTAKRLYIIYTAISVTLFLCLRIAGMETFDAVIQALGVAGTGGFGSKNDSMMSYTGYAIPWVMTIFMIMFGTNFSVYYQIFKGKIKDVLHNEEVRLYWFILAITILFITLNLHSHSYGSWGISLRDAAFQVSSIMSTSGYANANFDMWPSFSKFILMIVMFIGSCAGSTAGGIKVIRLLVLFKLVKREIQKVVHPKAVLPVTINGKIVSDEVVLGISSYMGIYIIIFGISVVIITLSESDLITSITSVLTMLSNTGPGLSEVGPTCNFAHFAPAFKWYFSLLMLLGRLEFFTLLAILIPKKKKNEWIRL